jgi:hypothetical protein
MCQGSGTVRKIAAMAAFQALQLAAASASASPSADDRPLPTEPSYGTTAEAACRRVDCGQAPRLRRLDFGAAPGISAALVEVDSGDFPGRQKRPRYALGMRSPALESALGAIGLDARQCLAPAVRMNTKLSTSFNLSGTLWVYLRCTLH